MPEGIQHLLEEVSDVAGHLWRKGWGERNAGNLSADVSDATASLRPTAGPSRQQLLDHAAPGLAGRSYWVTATGSRMRDLARRPETGSGIVTIDRDGRGFSVLAGGPAFRPTSELACHLAIHQALLRVDSPHRTVVHTHPTELIALSHHPDANEEKLNHLLWGMIPEAVVFVPEGLRLVPYMLPGSLAQATVSAEALQRHRVVLWEKHGVLAVAPTLGEAFDLIDTLNKSAQIYLACRTAGFEPVGMTREQIAELRRTFPAQGHS